MKKTVTLLFLFAVVAGFFALAVNAKSEVRTLDPTATAKPAQTATVTPWTCIVFTGIERGTVNLRACPGSMCGASLDVLTEGESLTILTAGAWMNVTTEDGVTGYINSKYCKGK